MDDYIVTLDIGSSSIYGAVGKIDEESSLHILGINSVKCNGLRNGIIIDIDETSKAIIKCLDNLQRITDIKIDEVFVSLSNGIIEIVRNKGIIAIASSDKEIKEKDLYRVIDATKILSLSTEKEIVGLIPEQYLVDGFGNINEPVGMSGTRLELDAFVVTAKSNIISNFRKSVEKAGVSIIGEISAAQALSHISIDSFDKSSSVLLIDCGFDKTDYSVFKNGKLILINQISMGGNSITKDIAYCMKISHQEAEKLKNKYGQLSISNDIIKESKFNNIDSYKAEEDKQQFINCIINARAEEILNTIRNELEKNLLFEDINSVVFVGGGLALFSDIVEFSKMIYNKKVSVGYPDIFGASNPKFSLSVGVIIDVYNSLCKNMKLSQDNEKDNFGLKHGMNNGEQAEGFINRIRNFFSDYFF
ncbi:cell division protein FtsA [Clostridium sp. DL1XJH146]